jgi:membrane-associated phospholipid phosphatase
MMMQGRAVFSLTLVISLVAAPTANLHAQADTVTPPRPLFVPADAALAGVFALGAYLAYPLDQSFARYLQRPENQQRKRVHRSATIVEHIAVPGAFFIGVGMYAGGRIGKSHKLADLGLHGTEALLIGEGLGGVMKGFFGRARPYTDTSLNANNWQLMRGFGDEDKYRSFPSGHTVAGFAAAAAVTAEMSRWQPDSRWIVGAVMYGGAGMVGLSRMYNNRHWASDVLVGAAIGTFAGNKVVRYHHSHPGNRIDEWLVNFNVVPTGTGHTLQASVFPRIR